MGSLDDLVALLLQGQHPFDDDALRQACAIYRSASPVRGAIIRKQVNLAICLYLNVTSERITEKRLTDLGGWGSRNDLLADISAFHAGARPASSVPVAVALPSVLPSSGLKASDALQIAMQQGLDAAQKMIEQSVRTEYERRLKLATDDLAQRAAGFEEMVAEAKRRQDAAEAQRLILERKFDEAGVSVADLTARLAAGQSTWESVNTMNAALTDTLARERSNLDAMAVQLKQAEDRCSGLAESLEREHRSNLLNVDAARQKDVSIAKLRSDIEKLNEKLGLATTDIAKANAVIAERDKLIAKLEASINGYQAAVTTALEQLPGLFDDKLLKLGDIQQQINSLANVVSDINRNQIDHTENVRASIELMSVGLKEIQDGFVKVIQKLNDVADKKDAEKSPE